MAFIFKVEQYTIYHDENASRWHLNIYEQEKIRGLPEPEKKPSFYIYFLPMSVSNAQLSWAWEKIL